jgi:hypothetical protein
MRRQSFIVQVHPGGVSVVENLRTRERARVEKLDAVGAQIERWVDDALDDADEPGRGGLVPSDDAARTPGAVDQGPD